mmetsp:Transcript_26228/g.38869  ORF Transcript_26228/g.38869 Transcript_26228/m.38869 type:complete len:238 (-) Transcript_26228:210-923(-)
MKKSLSRSKLEAMLLKGNTHPYTTRQDITRIQNGFGKESTSLNFTSSSMSSSSSSRGRLRSTSRFESSTASLFAAIFSSKPLSIGMTTIAQKTLEAQRMVPNHNAKGTPAESANTGERRLLKTEPSRATDRLRPNAKATSLPANQSARIEELATAILSPPNPKTTRPTNIIGHDLIDKPNAKMTCPAAMRETNNSKHRRTPNLSTKYPPKNGRKILGIEYTVYNKLKSVSKLPGLPI